MVRQRLAVHRRPPVGSAACAGETAAPGRQFSDRGGAGLDYPIYRKLLQLIDLGTAQAQFRQECGCEFLGNRRRRLSQ